MMRNKCWPTTFHTITTICANGWCLHMQVWSNFEGMTCTFKHIHLIRRSSYGPTCYLQNSSLLCIVSSNIMIELDKDLLLYIAHNYVPPIDSQIYVSSKFHLRISSVRSISPMSIQINFTFVASTSKCRLCNIHIFLVLLKWRDVSSHILHYKVGFHIQVVGVSMNFFSFFGTHETLDHLSSFHQVER